MGSFSAAHWIIFALFVLGLFSIARAIVSSGGHVSATGSMICPHCGTRGEPGRKTRGSLAIEILLWIIFILPGLIYSLWRLSTRYATCPACKQAGMIPSGSPNGRAIIAQQEAGPE